MSGRPGIAAALLAGHPLFSGVSGAGLEGLAAAARPVSLAPGQALFEQGAEADAAFFVLEGRVAIGRIGEQGQEVRFAELGEGALFGEAAVIDGGTRTAGATAASRCELLRLPGPALLTLAGREPAFSLALARDLLSKLRAADAQIEEGRLLPLDQRLARFLVSVARNGEVRLTQAEIADRLGVTREAVNRRLRAMEAAGQVRSGRGRVCLQEGIGRFGAPCIE